LKVVPREKREMTSFTSKAVESKKEKKAETKGEFEHEDEGLNAVKPSKWAFRMKHLIE
jgi:hypothetical protein